MTASRIKRIEDGMCVSCGHERARPGKRMCLRCAQITAAREQMRYEDMPEEKKNQKRAYMREYQRTHKPDKKKKAEWNRKWREENPTCMMVYKERWFYFRGERLRLPEIAKRVGIPYGTLYSRIYQKHMSLSEAIIRG
jgi:hypothetical protein